MACLKKTNKKYVEQLSNSEVNEGDWPRKVDNLEMPS